MILRNLTLILRNLKVILRNETLTVRSSTITVRNEKVSLRNDNLTFRSFTITVRRRKVIHRSFTLIPRKQPTALKTSLPCTHKQRFAAMFFCLAQIQPAHKHHCPYTQCPRFAVMLLLCFFGDRIKPGISSHG